VRDQDQDSMSTNRSGKTKKDSNPREGGVAAAALQDSGKTRKDTTRQEPRSRLVDRLEWALPCGVAFVASFCVMVVELVAGRLVARHLGASLYTWTSVIGVVLAGLAVGNYAGGRLADRYRPRHVLSILLILASACCLLSLPLNRYIGTWEALTSLNWPNRIAVHVTLIFLWPAALLGTIAPVVAKMALDQGRQAGRTVGNVYAWGTVGSIVGTFMTGYWFIASIGSTATIGLVCAVLAAMGMSFAIHSWLSRLWITAMVSVGVVLIAPWSWARAATVRLGLREAQSRQILFQTESAYSYIKVDEAPEVPGLRSLVLDQLLHSYVYMADPTQLHYEYEQIYATLTRRLAGERKQIRTLFLGGGGYVFPRYVDRYWPGSVIEVAEIDPEVTETVRHWLGMESSPSIRIHHLDARNYVEDLLKKGGADDNPPRFQFIYGDTFNHYSVPFHLTTLEFNEKLDKLLTDDGVYMLNVIDVLASGRFLGAVVNTLQKTFPEVAVIKTRPVLNPGDLSSRDTYVVVASRRKLDWTALARPGESDSLPGALLAPEQLSLLSERNRGIVLTDDYAPVENLLTSLFQGSQSTRWKRLNELGLEMTTKGDHKKAAEYYEEALRLAPDLVAIRTNLGWALFQSGQKDRGIEVLRQVVSQQPTFVPGHSNLGSALAEVGRHAEAIKEYEEALRLKPDFAEVHHNLGIELAGQGRVDQAIAHYEEALRIEPGLVEAHINLGTALAGLGKTDRAVDHYETALRLDPNSVEAHVDLANARLGRNEIDRAIHHYREALRVNPDFVEARAGLGNALVRQGKPDEAVAHFTEALRLEPNNADAHNSLGAILAGQGRGAEAVGHFERALALRPDWPQPLNNLAWILATYPEGKVRNGARAVQVAKQACELTRFERPDLLDTLAAAYAEAGQFQEAAKVARQGIDLASRSGQQALAGEIGRRLKLYEAGQPFRDAAH
jgi:tetratricopeptide (TPR) repeat protein/spermidine synthase